MTEYVVKCNYCERIDIEALKPVTIYGKHVLVHPSCLSERRAQERRSTEPTKTREGDQPLPIGEGQSVTDVVVARFRERERLGISRYKDTLRTFNGRDALLDALEEEYDKLQYMTQLLLERDASVEESAALLTKAFLAKKERDGDFISPRERAAYELGVRDAARIYFLSSKVASNRNSEFYEPVGDFTCTSANSKDCETRAKWMVWYSGARAIHTYACDFHLIEKLSEGTVDDVKPIGSTRKAAQDGK